MNEIMRITCVLLVLAFGAGFAQAGVPETNQAEQSAKRANPKGNSFASTQIHPAGTRFTITEIHPASAWYSYFYSTFYGKSATATDCASGLSYGIEYETSESPRAGYYTACFYLDGNSYQYFIYGFKFSLLSTTTPPPISSTTPIATYANGSLILKRMELDSGTGKTYYDVMLRLNSGYTSGIEFIVDSVVQSK